MKFTNEHIGCRVVYTDRDKSQHLGTIEGVDDTVPQVNVKLDGSYKERNWLPEDTLTFVPVTSSRPVESEEGDESGTVPPVV